MKPRRADTMRHPAIALALFACLILPAIGSAPARADGPGVVLRVVNDAPYQVKIAAAGSSNCWTDGKLGTGVIIPGGQTRDISSNASTDLFGCLINADRYRGIGIWVADAKGAWAEPVLSAQATPLQGQFQLTYDAVPGLFTLQNIPERWLPARPEQKGGSGPGGMICVAGPFGTARLRPPILAIHISTDPMACHSQAPKIEVRLPDDLPLPSGRAARPALAKAGSPPGGAVPPQVRLGSGGAEILNLFDVARTLCEWTGPTPRWSDRACADITNERKWDLDNVTDSVRSLKPVNPVVPIVGERLVDGPFRKDNGTEKDGELAYEYSLTQGERTTTETKHGFKKGFEIGGGAKFKVKLVELGVDLKGKFEWNDETTKATETNTEVSRTLTDSTTAAPGGTTYAYVFQGNADLAFNFTADLTAGEPGVAQPVRTPLARALGISPARIQPCLGYLIGPGERNSLLAYGGRLLAQGYSAEDPRLSPPRKALIRAVTGFSTSAGDRCPGWPEGYPAAWAFKGETSVRMRAAAPAQIPWATGMGEIRTCSYFISFSGREAAVDVNPCLGKAQGSGARAPRSAAPQTLAGNSGSNLLIAAPGGGVDTLRAGSGAYDVLQGAAGRQRLFGGGGRDYLIGKGGPDLLFGGAGDDSADGGAGNDRIRDDEGHNVGRGGPGNDRLASAGSARGGLFGGPGRDRLTLRGDGPVVLLGGRGDDLYRLVGNARAARAVEFGDEGVDTVLTPHSSTLPPNVERGVVAGRRGIALRGGDGSQELVGGPGGDRLVGGSGGDRLRGRGGDDLLELGDDGFDIAAGGAGADTFVPIARPASAPLGEHPRFGVPPTANLITDFEPAVGDRLVLRGSSYGRAVRALARRPLPRDGSNPPPRGTRPQLLFARKGSLLRIDPDGTGPRVAEVVAILAGWRTLPLAGVRFEPGR